MKRPAFCLFCGKDYTLGDGVSTLCSTPEPMIGPCCTATTEAARLRSTVERILTTYGRGTR